MVLRASLRRREVGVRWRQHQRMWGLQGRNDYLFRWFVIVLEPWI